jgi:putative transposase
VALIERDRAELPLCVQAQLLSVSRSSIYYQPIPPSPREVTLKHRIDGIYTERPFYGSRKITEQLRREDWVISRKTVQSYMQEMGIKAIYPGPNLSKRSQDQAIYPYLLRDIKCGWPDHIWGIDITYIRLTRGWMYLVAILDWFSRFVISWELDQTLELPFVLTAVERALAQATPQICNSDQGSHFTSQQYIERLLAKDVRISMDGKGRALDNIFTERLWRTLKYEEVYLHDYESPKAARKALTKYLTFYNQERPHQALGYKTPAEVYSQPRLAHLNYC